MLPSVIRNLFIHLFLIIFNFNFLGAGGFIVLPFAVWTLATLTHEHSEDGLVYQQIRNRPYPWKECSNCDFCNTDCWNDCRAQARGIKSNSGHH